jgi:hypothetical protein
VKSRTNKWLVVGGWLSLAAALLHVVCIFGGGDYYRFFGAGEEMARADEAGHWMPAIMTSGIAFILAIWAAYAFSGAGLIRRLPLIRTALVIISGIYLLRGLLIIPIVIEPEMRSSFNIWSSLIVLVFGLNYAIGTRLAWPQFSAPTPFQTERSV